MNSHSSDEIGLPPLHSPRGDRGSKLGVASFIASLSALLIVVILIVALFSPSYWASEGNNLIDALPLPELVIVLIILGFVLGIISLARKNSRRVFGIIGIILSGVAIMSCCGLFGLIFF